MAKNNTRRAVSAAQPSAITNIIAKQYRATNFDPTMLQINLLIKNSNLGLRLLSNRSGVSVSCMTNWKKQKTRRPQAITMRYVLRALGYDLKVMPAAGNNSALRTDDEE